MVIYCVVIFGSSEMSSQAKWQYSRSHSAWHLYPAASHFLPDGSCLSLDDNAPRSKAVGRLVWWAWNNVNHKPWLSPTINRTPIVDCGASPNEGGPRSRVTIEMLYVSGEPSVTLNVPRFDSHVPILGMTLYCVSTSRNARHNELVIINNFYLEIGLKWLWLIYTLSHNSRILFYDSNQCL